MNYLAEIKAFTDFIQIKQLSTGQIALWYALMSINNKCAWIEWFTCANLTLQLNTGMSRSGIVKARNSLKQYGLIDFKENGTKATSYKIITIAKSSQDSSQDSNQDSNQDSSQDSSQDSNQISSTLNKLNETKLNETVVADNIYNTASKFLAATADPRFSKLTQFYEANIGALLPVQAEVLLTYLDNFEEEEVIEEAIKRACLANARNMKYIKAILDNWQRKGVKVVADIDEKDRKGSSNSGLSEEEKRNNRLKLFDKLEEEGKA